MGAKRTLLEMTSEILQAMQSDEVDSITDTAESTAVASIIRRSYWDLFGLEEFPEHYTLFKLTATSAATPTLMTVPTNVFHIDWIQYNIETADNPDDQFIAMESVPVFSDFVNKQNMLIESADNITSFSYAYGTDSMKLLFGNDRFPRTYSSPDDFNILFDSYNVDEESCLSAARTRCWGIVDVDFTFADSFTPDLDTEQYSLLFNVAKGQAFVEMKQTGNAVADSRARRLMIKSQKTRNRLPGRAALSRVPNYGRK